VSLLAEPSRQVNIIYPERAVVLALATL